MAEQNVERQGEVVIYAPTGDVQVWEKATYHHEPVANPPMVEPQHDPNKGVALVLSAPNPEDYMHGR